MVISKRGIRPYLLSMVAAISASLVAAGCSATPGGEKERTGATRELGARSSTTSTRSEASSPAPPDGSTLHGVRYCEILTVRFAPEGGASAEVWNTMGLNDCPQDTWDAVDLEVAKTQTGAAVAVRNGPRSWVLDRIVPGAMSGSLEVQSFTGLEMRSIALVDLPSLTPSSVSPAPYTETSVLRDTVFTFAAGRRVYELTAPDGSIYVMQSSSQQVEPDLALADLAGLRARLDLPEGWRFTTRVLDEDLDVEDLEGIATVVQDDLHNTYQLRARG